MGLHELEVLYPDWEIGVVWTTRASGPDVRQLYAKRGRVKLVAFNASGLRRLIEEHGVAS